MWFYNILTVVVSIIVAIAVLYLLFRLFVLKQGDEKLFCCQNEQLISKYPIETLNLLHCSVTFLS